MVEYKPLQQRVQEDMDEARARDEAYLKLRRFALSINSAVGTLGGLLIAMIPAFCGSIQVAAILALSAASGSCLLAGSLMRMGIFASMLTYPLVMVPLALAMRYRGMIRCDDAVCFVMVLAILVGMSCSYVFGWVRNQSDP